MQAKFELGQLVATRGVANLMSDDPVFSDFTRRSLRRFISGDWGEMCESDKQQNEDALKHHDNRIFAAYENAEHAAWKLRIITEMGSQRHDAAFPQRVLKEVADMNGFPSRAVVESLPRKYPAGTRVALVSMNDPYTKLRPGDEGAAIAVDDIGTVHIQWASSSTLGAVYGADVIRKL